MTVYMSGVRKFWNDKRFWIFELSTLIYSVLMVFLISVLMSSSTLTFYLSAICFFCFSGLITWIFADGRHWLIFALIFEVVSVFLISLIFCIGGLLSTGGIKNLTGDDGSLLWAIIFNFALFAVIPNLLLSFIGYKIFNRR